MLEPGEKRDPKCDGAAGVGSIVEGEEVGMGRCSRSGGVEERGVDLFDCEWGGGWHGGDCTDGMRSE